MNAKRIVLAALASILVLPSPSEPQTFGNALTVARLPPCTSGRQGRLLVASDTDGDCNTGGGSTYALCVCEPAAPGNHWVLKAPSDALTGTYAGSATDGGPATTALALSANGTNCSTNQAAAGVSAAGDAEGCVSFLPLSGGTLTGATVGTWFDASFFRGMVSTAAVVQINRGTQTGGRSNGVSLAQNRDICWSSAATADDSFDTCLYRPSANVLELTDGNTGNSRLQARGIRLIPRSSPVSTCDSGVLGLSYFDSDDGDFCDCVAPSGTPAYRSRGGAGSCS